jgi:hypothetical protein
MKRIFVAPKDGDADEETEEQVEDLTKYEVKHTYSEALAQFLKPGERAPRHIEERENGIHLVKSRKKRLLNQVDVDSDDMDDPKDVDYVYSE